MSVIRYLYATVATVYSICGLLLVGLLWRQMCKNTSNRSVALKREIIIYMFFRAIMAPTMVFAHMVYLWPMRFDEHTAESLTLSMASFAPALHLHCDDARDEGASVYTVLYQWLCNLLLPAVAIWGIRIMINVRNDQLKQTKKSDDDDFLSNPILSTPPLPNGDDDFYPFGLEVIANGLFVIVVCARFLSIVFNLGWFYLAWAEPFPTIAPLFFRGDATIVFLPWIVLIVWRCIRYPQEMGTLVLILRNSIDQYFQTAFIISKNFILILTRSY